MPREALQKSHIQKTAFYTQTITETDTYHKNFTSKFSVYYSPYGTLLDGRHGNETSYRFGYQGSEKDDEIKNISGSSYTTHFRMLDPRIGRWFSTDPVFQPWQSPYSSMDNNPVLLNDPLGNVASGDRGKGRKHTKTVNEDPEKAARKYASKHGYNGNNAKMFANEDGSISLQRRYRPNSKDNADEVTVSAIMLFKPSNRYLNKQRKAYEAEKAREYNNSHGMFRNFDFNHGIGGVSNTAYTEGSATDEVRAQWEYHRANVAAVNVLADRMLKTSVAFVVGGNLFYGVSGTGVVASELELVKDAYTAYKAKLFSGLIGFGVNYFGQLTMNDWDYSKMDQVGPVVAFFAPFLPYSPYASATLESAVDASFDYSKEKGFKSILNGKNALLIASDFIFNLGGNMGAASFGKVPPGFEIVSESVTNIPTGVVNNTVNNEIGD